jgi:hypothetical protein
MPESKFLLKTVTLGRNVDPFSIVDVTIVRMDRSHPVIRDTVLTTKPSELTPRLIEECPISRFVRDPQKHRRGIGDRPESSLALTKRAYLCLKEAQFASHLDVASSLSGQCL